MGNFRESVSNVAVQHTTMTKGVRRHSTTRGNLVKTRIWGKKAKTWAETKRKSLFLTKILAHVNFEKKKKKSAENKEISHTWMT